MLPDLPGCWLWQLSTNHFGYGKASVPGHPNGWVLAHRLSYELFVGAIPDGMCVLHKCDTPACTRPDHLFLGTHADNVADKVRKGRQPVGADAWQASPLLSDAAVVELRSGRLSDDEAAAKYLITPVHAKMIRLGHSWKHVAAKPTRKPTPRGSRASRSKLSESDVLSIRAASDSDRDCARRYGVTRQSIAAVRSRKVWRHVP